MLSKESARTPAVPNRFLHSSPMAAVFALVSALSSSSLPGVGPVGMETTEGRINLRRLEPAAHNTGNHAQTNCHIHFPSICRENSCYHFPSIYGSCHIYNLLAPLSSYPFLVSIEATIVTASVTVGAVPTGTTFLLSIPGTYRSSHHQLLGDRRRSSYQHHFPLIHSWYL